MHSTYKLNDGTDNALNDMKQICLTNPLVKLAPEKSATVKDLLLSSTAIGSGINREQVNQAFDELISLQYPVINRILEIAANLCSQKRLNIYFCSGAEFCQLGLQNLAGTFSPAHGMLVISNRDTFSQTLIHEVTHAVRFYLNQSLNMHTLDHEAFCRSNFPRLFQEIKNHKGHTRQELADLKAIEDHIHNGLKNLRVSITREQAQVFHVRRGKVNAQSHFRNEFLKIFPHYKPHEYAEEFLPFFLEHFVKAAHHEKISSLEAYAKSVTSNVTQITANYYSQIIRMMWNALPEELLSPFVKDGFRVALDHEAQKAAFRIKPLSDNFYYELSPSEPNRIINNNYSQ